MAEILAEMRSAVLPLAPNLDTLCWLRGAVALGEVAVTMYGQLDDWKRGRGD